MKTLTNLLYRACISELLFLFPIVASAQTTQLWAVAPTGGSDNGGTIFSIKSDGSNFTDAYNFPVQNKGKFPYYNSPCIASNGKFYFMTSAGGLNDDGVLFSFDPSTNTYTELIDFDKYNTGSSPMGGLIQAQDGKLYGTTYDGGLNQAGTLFRFDPVTNIFTKLFDFGGSKGGNPLQNLMQASDGKLYGTASTGGGLNSYGVLFSFDLSTNTFKKLLVFTGANGQSPNGNLLQAKNGKLYGLTAAGGTYNEGVLYSFVTGSKMFTKLADLVTQPVGGVIQASNGVLYGNTTGSINNDPGTLFSYNISTGTLTTLYSFVDDAKGKVPLGNLMQALNGTLYGSTEYGGDSPGFGVLFSFNINTSSYSAVYHFDGIGGSNPTGNLVQALDGKLYGVTVAGGVGESGTLFSFNTNFNSYTKLLDLNSYILGIESESTLLYASNKKLYGVSLLGGNYNEGVLFDFDPTTSTYNKLFDFTDESGAWPAGGLIQASDGKLYGVTNIGGQNGYGVLYSFDVNNNTYTKIYDFTVYNPGPVASLVQASNGKLYGGTYYGGKAGLGVIFSFDLTTNTYTKLFDFSEGKGSGTASTMCKAADGKLYGTTAGGGKNDNGVLFSFDPSNDTYTKLYNFSFPSEANPYGGLVQASNGKLYGMSELGGFQGSGVIYSFDITTKIFASLFSFDYTNGEGTNGSLMQAMNGKLFGMTSRGGSYDKGVLFSFDPVTNIYQKLRDLNSSDGINPETSAFVEIPTQNAITTDDVSQPLCRGKNTSVSYTAIGTFNADNIFTAQLSHFGGSFDDAVSIGTLSSTVSGTIIATVPSDASADDHYRIRVVSSDPPVTGDDNGYDIPIPGCAPPTGLVASNITSTSATLSWTAPICADSYTVSYRHDQSMPWTQVDATTNSVAISNLQAATSYTWRVMTTCNSDPIIVSGYSVKKTFTTETMKLNLIGSPSSLSIYPNPSSGNITIMYSGDPGNIQFIIYNMMGKIVFNKTQPANNNYRFDLSNLEPDIYLIEARNGKDISQAKFVIEK